MLAMFELREFMIAAKRQVLVRENPDKSRAQIDALLRAWVVEPVCPAPRFAEQHGPTKHFPSVEPAQ